MGIPQAPHKVKLIAGLLSNDIRIIDEARDSLSAQFGKTDFESAILDFTHSDYYHDEMGDGLKRRFLSFSEPLDLKLIYRVKLETNLLEGMFSTDGRRKVNIDPGYLDLAKVVLFSTKDYIHRIYLDEGIFADATLFYRHGSFNAWPWTYPDYKTGAYIDIFNSIRKFYAERSKQC